MPFALELFWDERTDAEVRRVWHQLSEVTGVDYLLRNGVRPHVALAVFESKAGGLSGWQEKVGKEAARFGLKPDGIGTFDNGVVFVRIRRDEKLEALHRACLGFCRDIGASVSPYYTPERWQPHCTLAQSLPQVSLEQAARIAAEELRPCPWMVSAIGIVSFPPTALVEEKWLT